MLKVYWITPSDQERHSLRRFERCDYDEQGYRITPAPPCTLGPYHDAEVILGVGPVRDARYNGFGDDSMPHDDPRWPTHCACGYAFQEDDHWQARGQRLWSGAPDGQLYTLHEAPVGAMWDADWMPSSYAGPDGICLVVKTPGGSWMVDGTASNCTRPNEQHQCWVRHGDPRTEVLHVDKNGDTCAAGAGSIIIGNYHGFLHQGHLTNA